MEFEVIFSVKCVRLKELLIMSRHRTEVWKADCEAAERLSKSPRPSAEICSRVGHGGNQGGLESLVSGGFLGNESRRELGESSSSSQWLG